MQKRSHGFAVIALMVASVISTAAQQSPPKPGRRIVLHAARLLDVQTGTTLSDQVIVIEGEKITAVGPAKSVNAASDGEQIELRTRPCSPA